MIRRSRRGDTSAFEELVESRRGMALRVAFHIVGDEDDAKDVAQRSFIRLWRSLGTFDPDEPFDPWFYRIVVNLAIDFLRSEQRRRRRITPITGDPALLPGAGKGDRADRAAMIGELRRIFGTLAVDLSPMQRAVFTLKEIEDVPTDKIGEILQIQPSTVRNHLMQARRTLREGLVRRFPEYVRRPRR